MKRLLSLTALLFLAVASFAHDFEVDGIYYVITSSSSDSPTVSVSYKGTSYDSYSDEYTGSVTIPETVTYSGKTYSVTSIGSYAFSRCTTLLRVTIPTSVSNINKYAFWQCTGLSSVTIPEGVTSIGSRAFSSCKSLTSITFPNGVTSIGEYAFDECDLTNVTIPSSVTSIGKNAFAYQYSHYRAHPLTNVTLNSDAIASKTYSSLSSLKNIFGADVKNYILGDNVTSIGDCAFYGCSDQTSITIPESVTSIGGAAFPKDASLYVKSFTKTHFDLLKNGYTHVYDIESKKNIVPSLSATSTQTTLQISIVNRISEFVYTYGGKQITSDIVGTVTGLRPDASRSFYVQVSFDGQSYTMEKTFYTRSISPSVSSTTSASSLQATGSYVMGDAKVINTVIKCNGKKVEGNNISLMGLIPDTSYDVEYTVTVAYGSNNQSTYSYTGTKTVKTQELTLTTEQPKVVSMGNVIVSATTNVDPEEKNVGFEWRREDWSSTFASQSGAAVVLDGTMEGYIRNLYTGKLWNYRAYYLSDSGTYYYGDWVGIDPTNTSYFEPTVYTYADISTSGKVALIRGYVLNGSDKVTVQGFKYWKTANKSNSLDIAMEGKPQAAVVYVPADAITETVAIVGAGQQLMNATLENLDYGSTYQCVAFATTSENETFYGEVQSFTTEADPTGIEGVKEDAGSSKPVTVVACYDINGKRLSQPQKGLNILKMSDGTTRKVVR